MGEQSRLNHAARQYVFGLLAQAGADVYSAGACGEDVDGVIRVVVGGEVRHWDLVVCSADTWTDFPIPVERLATDRSVLLALNWTTRELFWLPGAALRHRMPGKRKDAVQGVLNKLSRPHLEADGATDLKKLLHFTTE